MNARKILLWSAILIAVLIIALVVVANFSETETVLSCKGEITTEEQTRPSNLYISLNEYRWWVRLWSDSDGMMRAELSDGFTLLFLTLEDLGFVVHIYRGFPSDEDFELNGSYSKLSKTLKLVTPLGFFEGTCTATT